MGRRGNPYDNAKAESFIDDLEHNLARGEAWFADLRRRMDEHARTHQLDLPEEPPPNPRHHTRQRTLLLQYENSMPMPRALVSSFGQRGFGTISGGSTCPCWMMPASRCSSAASRHVQVLLPRPQTNANDQVQPLGRDRRRCCPHRRAGNHSCIRTHVDQYLLEWLRRTVCCGGLRSALDTLGCRASSLWPQSGYHPAILHRVGRTSGTMNRGLSEHVAPSLIATGTVVLRGVQSGPGRLLLGVKKDGSRPRRFSSSALDSCHPGHERGT
jgi:hypothetical protein